MYRRIVSCKEDKAELKLQRNVRGSLARSLLPAYAEALGANKLLYLKAVMCDLMRNSCNDRSGLPMLCLPDALSRFVRRVSICANPSFLTYTPLIPLRDLLYC